MDGQFHAIEFDPSATAEEVLKLVRVKIGLRENAEGKIIIGHKQELANNLFQGDKRKCFSM